MKDAPPERLADAIRAVARGDAVLSPRVTRRLLETFARELPEEASEPSGVEEGHPRLRELTAREREVLLELAAGRTNAEIAERLVVSDSTVKTHVGRILGKLGLRDRVQAVILAYELGLVRRR